MIFDNVVSVLVFTKKQNTLRAESTGFTCCEENLPDMTEQAELPDSEKR